MKKFIKRLILCAVLMLSCIGLVACGSKTDTGKTDKYIVTFFDADQKTVLKTEEVEKGGKPPSGLRKTRKTPRSRGGMQRRIMCLLSALIRPSKKTLPYFLCGIRLKKTNAYG